MSENTNAIEIKGLRKTFKKQVALKGVDLSLTSGSFTVIMGPSGSGKTTLLKCASGLEQADEDSSVLVAGQQVVGMTPKDRVKFRRGVVGFVFQDYNLIPVLTARENLNLVNGITGARTDGEWFDRVTVKLGVSDFLDRKPTELSGGQQQRVSIARALLKKPEVIFADEPTGALDSKTSKDVMDLLRDECDSLHITILLVTHNDKVAEYADSIVRLKDGRIDG